MDERGLIEKCVECPVWCAVGDLSELVAEETPRPGMCTHMSSFMSDHSALLSLFPVLLEYAPGLTIDNHPFPPPTRTNPHGVATEHSIGGVNNGVFSIWVGS